MGGTWNSAGSVVVAEQLGQVTAWSPGRGTFCEVGVPQAAQAPLASQKPGVRPFTRFQGWETT